LSNNTAASCYCGRDGIYIPTLLPTATVDYQVTYVKKLDTITAIKIKTIEYLIAIIKDNIVLSRDHFQQITKDIMWLISITLCK
jgi:hypothetical protein